MFLVSKRAREEETQKKSLKGMRRKIGRKEEKNIKHDDMFVGINEKI